MSRKVSKKYFVKVAKELDFNGPKIAKRIGRTRQAVNARLRRLAK